MLPFPIRPRNLTSGAEEDLRCAISKTVSVYKYLRLSSRGDKVGHACVPSRTLASAVQSEFSALEDAQDNRTPGQLCMMHSFTLASLGFLGLQLNAACGFLVPVPAQAAVSQSTRNMRSTSSALDATVGTSEWRAAINHTFVRWGRYR